MNNVEKRLQEKVRREEASEQRKYNRRLRRIEGGTKKICYTILKHTIKQKDVEDLSIVFREFTDFNNMPFIYCVYINQIPITIGKTYLDFAKLKNYLEKYSLSLCDRGPRTFSTKYMRSEKRYFLDNKSAKSYVTGLETVINGKRSDVLDSLLNIHTKEQTTSHVGGPKLTKK